MEKGKIRAKEAAGDEFKGKKQKERPGNGKEEEKKVPKTN